MVGNIRNKVDADKIREMLCEFMDNHNYHAPTVWAQKIGIGAPTLFSFIHGARKPRRGTLLKVYDYIEAYIKQERETNQVHIELDKDTISMQINKD